MWPDIDAWSIVRLTSFRKGLLFGKGWQGYQMDFFVTVQKIKHSTALSLLLKVKSESDICFWWLKISLFFSKVFRLCIGKHGTIQCLLKIDFKLLPLCRVIYFFEHPWWVSPGRLSFEEGSRFERCKQDLTESQSANEYYFKWVWRSLE